MAEGTSETTTLETAAETLAGGRCGRDVEWQCVPDTGTSSSYQSTIAIRTTDTRWLAWHSSNGVGHINEVKLHQAQLVLGLVTIVGPGSTIPVLSRPLRPTQPGHPSVGRCNEYWRRFRPPLGKKRRVLQNSGPCYQDCRHTD